MGDGDLTYDFTKLGDLVRPILAGEAQFVIGNRMGNILPGAMPPLHRYVGNPILSGLLRLMFRDRRVRDVHCGLRAISRGGLPGAALRHDRDGVRQRDGGAGDPAPASSSPQRDIVYHPRIGDSKLQSFRDGWRHLRFLMLHSPTMLLLLPGAVCWVLGLLLALPMAFGPVVIGGRNIDIHFMIMAGLLNIVGIQIVTIGAAGQVLRPPLGAAPRRVRRPALPLVHLREDLPRLGDRSPSSAASSPATVVVEWVLSGFGSLNRARMLFFALLLLVDGVQLGLASYLFSIMALPRHIDALTAENENTGIADL